MVARLLPFGLTVALAAGVAVAAPPKVPDPKPDHAMLILMRPGDPGGGDIVTDYLFADDKLIALSKGGTHTFVDQPAGTRVIWCQGGAGEIDFVPGRKYYVVCGFFHGFSLLSEEAGQTVLARTKPGPVVTPQADEGARKRIDRFYAPLRKEIDKQHELLPAAAAPAEPADTTGRIQVPRYSPVTLELMENVSSATAKAGEKLAFRVAEANTAEAKPWLSAGSVVEGVILDVATSGRGGRAGVIVADVAAVTTSDGVAVPLMGQLITTAKSRAVAANVGLALGGILGHAMVKGNEAGLLAGERFDFFTRDDVRVLPLADAATSPPPPADLQVKFATPLDPAMLIKGSPGRMQLLIQSEAPIARVALTSVGDWTLPVPVPAASVTGSAKQGWVADFDSWSILRHLRVSDTPMPVRFRVEQADGKALIAEATAVWPVKPGP